MRVSELSHKENASYALGCAWVGTCDGWQQGSVCSPYTTIRCTCTVRSTLMACALLVSPVLLLALYLPVGALPPHYSSVPMKSSAERGSVADIAASMFCDMTTAVERNGAEDPLDVRGLKQTGKQALKKFRGTLLANTLLEGIAFVKVPGGEWLLTARCVRVQACGRVYVCACVWVLQSPCFPAECLMPKYYLLVLPTLSKNTDTIPYTSHNIYSGVLADHPLFQLLMHALVVKAYEVGNALLPVCFAACFCRAFLCEKLPCSTFLVSLTTQVLTPQTHTYHHRQSLLGVPTCSMCWLARQRGH